MYFFNTVDFTPIIIIAVIGVIYIVIYDVVVVSLIIRFLVNRTAYAKAGLYLDRQNGIGGILGLLWKTFKFEYFDNLNHKSWISTGLKWHIRIFRYMFYGLLLVVLVGLPLLIWYLVSVIDIASLYAI